MVGSTTKWTTKPHVGRNANFKGSFSTWRNLIWEINFIKNWDQIPLIFSMVSLSYPLDFSVRKVSAFNHRSARGLCETIIVIIISYISVAYNSLIQPVKFPLFKGNNLFSKFYQRWPQTSDSYTRNSYVLYFFYARVRGHIHNYKVILNVVSW